MDQPRSEEIHGSAVGVTGAESTRWGNGEKVDVGSGEEADSAAAAMGEEKGKAVYTEAEDIRGAGSGGSERVYDFDAGVSFADLACYVAGCK